MTRLGKSPFDDASGVDAHLLPTANKVFDVGSPDREFRNVYISGDVNPGALDARLLNNGGYQVVGTRSTQIGIFPRIAVGTTGVTSMVGHIIPYSCSNIRLRYGNHYVGGDGETPNTDSINVKCSITYPLGAIWPIFFNGLRTIFLTGGSLVDTDIFGLDINSDVVGTCTDSAATTTVFTTDIIGYQATNIYGGQIVEWTSGALLGQRQYITATGYNITTYALTVGSAFSQAPARGDTFKIIPVVYSKTFYSAATGTVNIPVGTKALGGGSAAPYEGRTTGSDLTDVLTAVSNSTASVYAPCSIIAQPQAKLIPAIASSGDSIEESVGDSDASETIVTVAGIANNMVGTGYIVRALNNRFPYVRLGKAAEQTHHFMNYSPSTPFARVIRMDIATGCTHFVCNYGRNDAANSITLVQFQANLLNIAKAANTKGQQFLWTGITPDTTSTDGWSTTTNQAQLSWEAVRVSFNEWGRDPGPNGFVARAGGSKKAVFLDYAQFLEVNSLNILIRNGGFWLSPTGGASVSSTATGGTTGTLVDSTQNWAVDQWKGVYIFPLAGAGAGDTPRYIISNTSNTLTTSSTFTTTPDATTVYKIVDTATIDGIHPSVKGHVSLASTIPPTLFTV